MDLGPSEASPVKPEVRQGPLFGAVVYSVSWARTLVGCSQQREAVAQRVSQSRGQEKVLIRTGRYLDLLLTYASEAELLANFDNVLMQARVVDAQVSLKSVSYTHLTLPTMAVV